MNFGKKQIALCCALIGFCGQTVGADGAKAAFIDGRGKEIGMATMAQTPAGVLIKLEVSGLPEGEHAFHVHETGKCEPKDGFKSAGGHLAAGRKHGFHEKEGPHPGDMPNQFVGKEGELRAEILNSRLSLAAGKANVFDKDGSAFVIHAKPDDYQSQPAGEAGERIACAVIRKG